MESKKEESIGCKEIQLTQGVETNLKNLEDNWYESPQSDYSKLKQEIRRLQEKYTNYIQRSNNWKVVSTSVIEKKTIAVSDEYNVCKKRIHLNLSSLLKGSGLEIQV